MVELSNAFHVNGIILLSEQVVNNYSDDFAKSQYVTTFIFIFGRTPNGTYMLYRVHVIYMH